MSAVPSDVLGEVDALQARYIGALDGKRMDEWLACFSTALDASYVLTTAENADANRPLALILDDCRGRLEDRVAFVNRVWRGTYQEYRTRHFLQRISCKSGDDGCLDVTTNFTVMFTPEDTGRTELFAAGVYADRILAGAGGGLIFQSKKAVMDSPLLARYLVYPL